jgi:tRNA pseudouridine13 synthase
VDPVVDQLSTFGGLETDDPRPSVGVPNWFGQQRFGSRRPITHEVGLAIARADWEGAVMAYLGRPTAAEPESTQAARAFVEDTRDWGAALDRFPRRLGYERAMLHELASCDGDPGPGQFRAALESVPTSLQRLFVHAAQSYAFNRMLSERLARGLPFDRPVPGDVVCFADRSGVLEDGAASDGTTAVSPSVALPDVDRIQRVDERRVETVSRHCERARAFVTAPLVGTKTTFAEGEQGAIEREVLADLDLERADFDLPGEFHSTGTRRAILVRTDLDVARDPLTLSFALPKGSYATVLLREILKTDPVDLG